MKRIPYFKLQCLGIVLVASLIWPSTAFTSCEWYFNWYCSGCSKIGARTTGEEGPFSSQSACESARSSMQSRMGSRGGGVRAESCYQPYGCIEISPSRRPDDSPRPGPSEPSYQDTLPSYDYEAERMRRETEEKKQAEEAKRLKKEAEENFKIEQKKALESLKGTGTGTVDLKSSDDAITPFGIKGSPPPEEVRLKGMGRPKTSGITSAWRQLHCGASISGYALKEANKKKVDYQEVYFLVEEAGKALDGGALRVECAKPPPPPKPYGKVKLDSDSPLVRFYKELLWASDKETNRLEKAEKEIREAPLKKKKAEKQVKKAQEEITRLEEEIKGAEKPMLPPSALEKEEKEEAKEPKPENKAALSPEELKAKRRALEEARAALKKAKEAMDGVEKTIKAAEKDKAGARERLGRYEEMFNKVQKDPALAGSYTKKITK